MSADAYISPDELNRRVQFQRVTRSEPNSFGESTETWTPYANVFASIKAISGIEAVRGQMPVGVTKYTIKCRWSRDWTPTTHDRIIYNGRAMNIEYINDLGMAHVAWVITASEVEGVNA